MKILMRSFVEPPQTPNLGLVVSLEQNLTPKDDKVTMIGEIHKKNAVLVVDLRCLLFVQSLNEDFPLFCQTVLLFTRPFVKCYLCFAIISMFIAPITFGVR
jgi:hypothetical protein